MSLVINVTEDFMNEEKMTSESKSLSFSSLVSKTERILTTDDF